MTFGKFFTNVGALGSAIIFGLAGAETTTKENVIYELEMVGGGVLIIILGLAIWKRYENKSELDN